MSKQQPVTLAAFDELVRASRRPFETRSKQFEWGVIGLRAVVAGMELTDRLGESALTDGKLNVLLSTAMLSLSLVAEAADTNLTEVLRQAMEATKETIDMAKPGRPQ